MVGVNIYQVDSFTNEVFRGNPAAVCILTKPLDADWAQRVAAEMNLAETAFLYPEVDGYGLRWFTPTVEVELCGHATLASAHILWERNYLGKEREVRFYTKSGLLIAKWHREWIELDFPATPATEVDPPACLMEALGLPLKYVGLNKFDYLVEVESEEMVRSLEPDLALLRQLGTRGVIVTSASLNSEYDFVSRFFGPGVGIDEDPVTGSAHCCLGPFWQEKLGRDTFTAYQASSRGGNLKVDVRGDRVHLFGQAVTVFAGELQAF